MKKIKLKLKALTLLPLAITPAIFMSASFDAKIKNSTFKKQFDIIGVKDSSTIYDIKVAILEPGHIQDSLYSLKESVISFTNLDNKDHISKHKTLIASIIVGDNGINPYGRVFDIGYDEYNDFSKKMKTLSEIGVSIVNLSYNYGDKEGNRKTYDWNAQYLDYISRKYGITFVIASGNNGEYNTEKQVGKWFSPYLDGFALSLNTIKVGSVGYNTSWQNFEKMNDEEIKELYSDISGFSSHLVKQEDFKERGVNVVAPGAMIPIWYTLKHDQYFKETVGSIYDYGTSFSAPFVVGALARIMSKYPDLNYKPHVSLLLTTLGAKTMTKQAPNLSNGLNDKVGSGLLNFELMEKAAKNVKVYEVNKNSSESSLNYRTFKLNAGDKFKGSVAWLNNSFFSSKDEKDLDIEWFNEPSARNKIEQDISLQNNSIHKVIQKMENFDLELQIQKDGNWKTVQKSSSQKSNIELIEKTISESGEYRLVVKFPSELKTDQKVKLALGYVVE